jgi:hypothetical protein
MYKRTDKPMCLNFMMNTVQLVWPTACLLRVLSNRVMQHSYTHLMQYSYTHLRGFLMPRVFPPNRLHTQP